MKNLGDMMQSESDIVGGVLAATELRTPDFSRDNDIDKFISGIGGSNAMIQNDEDTTIVANKELNMENAPMGYIMFGMANPTAAEMNNAGYNKEERRKFRKQVGLDDTGDEFTEEEAAAFAQIDASISTREANIEFNQQTEDIVKQFGYDPTDVFSGDNGGVNSVDDVVTEDTAEEFDPTTYNFEDIGSLPEDKRKMVQRALGTGDDGKIGKMTKLAYDNYEKNKKMAEEIPELSARDINRIIEIESRGAGYTAKHVSDKTKRITAYGKYQFIKSTAKEVSDKLGLKWDSSKKWYEQEWTTPENQDKMFTQFTKDNIEKVKKFTEPSVYSIYGAHQQGVDGFKNILNGTSYKSKWINLISNMGYDSKELETLMKIKPTKKMVDDMAKAWIELWSKKLEKKPISKG